MRVSKSHKFQLSRRPVVIGVLVIALAGMLVSSIVASGQGVDSRPRNAQGAKPAPSPTPVQTAPAQPTPTPASTTQPGQDRIAPKLGEPPPPPKLKPTPTPTPPEEIDPESRITINADLVNLHVRVIDRNNRPIDRITQGEFHVY